LVSDFQSSPARETDREHNSDPQLFFSMAPSLAFTSLTWCFFLLHSLTCIVALPTKEWKRRTVYQIITDRFALGPGQKDTCDDKYDLGQECKYGNYCGGSFAGIADKLDYIQGMGFDAIWISPIASNTACGYHGYWTRSLYEVNEHFGGAKELKKMMDAAHARGIAVMFDSVLNHFGPATVEAAEANSYSMYTPFDKEEYFHGNYTTHPLGQMVPVDGSQHDREVGWMGILGELPDLKQEHPVVGKLLVDWIQGLRDEYHIDGFRIDALPYINKSFYRKLKTGALSDVFTTGEIIIGGKHLDFYSSYQYTSPDATGDAAADNVFGWVIDSIINYDLNNALQHVFQIVDTSMPLPPIIASQEPYDRSVKHYADALRESQTMFKDFGALANFVSVHDQPRWLYTSPDTRTYKNAWVAVFFLPGVPIHYYGDEQALRGGNVDNTCRLPLWQYGYNQSNPMYVWITSAVSARKSMLKSLTDENIDDIQDLVATDYALSFQRGAVVVIVEKLLPASIVEEVIKVKTNYEPGAILCDSLHGSQYCATVGEEGTFEYRLSGMPKVLFPKSAPTEVPLVF